ncbi:MAG: folylpolyglutamate synthase/dihydrofolate synthase family protein [Filifactor alocis]|nr:folylpolyglutamate synthase/dihydrofolate synthase family protein [Filifactor alocis]
MQIEEAQHYIWNRPKIGRTVGLHRMEYLMSLFDDVHKKLKAVHVAGTNGKGSVCTYINGILRNADYKVGLYTSPHLIRVNERFKINDRMIEDEELAHFTSMVAEKEPFVIEKTGEGLSEFEVLTAIAFLYFHRQECDFVILEVGLGGRFDATNICSPIVSVITSIGLDHELILGDTVTKIAFEKSGIIKEEVPVIVAPQRTSDIEEVIFESAFNRQATAYMITVDSINITGLELGKLTIDFKSPFRRQYYGIETKMFGIYQAENVATAISVLNCLEDKSYVKISESTMMTAIRDAQIFARMEVVAQEPLTLVDGAHNSVGLELLYDTMYYFKQSAKIKGFVLVFAMMKDKMAQEMVDRLVDLSDHTIFTHLDSQRAMELGEFERRYRHQGKKVEFLEGLEAVIQKAEEIAGSEELCILYAGSLYLAGEIKKRYQGRLLQK